MKTEEVKTEGPYYLVKEGTNLRICSDGFNIGTPSVYDAIEIAQHKIDHENQQKEERDRLLVRKPSSKDPLVSISVKEYNRKYAKIMGIKED